MRTFAPWHRIGYSYGPKNLIRMKKLLFLLACLLPAFGAYAQDAAILDKIEKANAGMKTVQCQFTEKRTLTATGRSFDFDGTVYYQAPDRLAMRFTKPGELMVIDGATLYMGRAPKPALFNTDKTPLMLSLRNTLLYCVGGQPRKVAQENDADIAVKEGKDGYIVQLTARKHVTKGYARIHLTYRKSDCVLVRMEMEEFGGIIDLYQMSDIRRGVSVDPAMFQIPVKQ